jgi:hypothetical protein
MDAIMGFLHSAMPLLAFAWGLLCKYLPKLASIPNASIPWVNALLFLVTSLAGPQPAHAGGFLGLGGGTFLGQLVASMWQSAGVSIFYEFFARHPLKAITPQPTP